MVNGGVSADRNGGNTLLRLIWAVTAVVFFVLALLWAGSKLRHTGDTWIGLAAGRNICEHGFFNFPLKDQWTFLFNDKTWWNQNWLTHVAYWLVYHYISPGSLVALKLVLVVLTGLILWNSCEVLSRSRPISLLLTSVGLLVLSEFIDIRPNHVGIVCSGAMFWLLIRLKYGGRWAIWWIPVLLLVWGNAHGSFLFGYVLVAMFVCTEAAQRLIRRRAILATWKDLVWLCATTAGSAVALLIISPYHFTNFTHPLLIMVSKDKDTFQRVMEWLPAWEDMKTWTGPPDPAAPFWFPKRPWVGAYWWLFAASVVIWLVATPLWLRRRRRSATALEDAAEPAAFDLTEWAFVAASVYFSLTSRRFVPLFVLFAMPVTAKMIVLLINALSDDGGETLRVPPSARSTLLLGVTVLSVIGSAFIVFGAQLQAATGLQGADLNMWRAYMRPKDSHQAYDDYLFEGHTGRAKAVIEMLDFARNAGLSGRVFNEWTWGGYLMFAEPEFKLFIDGRSQALFPATHFQRYWATMGGIVLRDAEQMKQGSYPAKLDHALQEIGVNIVMVKRRPREGETIINPLLATGLWEPVFESESGDGAMLLLRKNSGDPTIEEALRRFYTGDLKWPDTRLGWRVRGYALQSGPNPDWRGSLAALKRSLEMGPDNWVYDRLVLRAFNELNDREGAIEFFKDELARLSKTEGKTGPERDNIERCLLTVRRALRDLQVGESLLQRQAQEEAEKAATTQGNSAP